MDMPLIGTVADATQPGQLRSLKGPCSVRDIVLYYHGTNQAALTARMANDLGPSFKIKEVGNRAPVGDVLSLARPQFLMTQWEYIAGWFHEVSVAGGDYTAVLPASFAVGDNCPNALFVPAGNELEIEIPPLDEAGANIANVSCTIFAVLSDLSHTRYVPRIFQRRIDLAGQERHNIPEATALSILTSSTGNDPDYVRFLQGASDRKMDAPPEALYALYQTLGIMGALPTMAGDVVFDWTRNGRDIAAAIGGGWYLETVGGTNHAHLMTYGLDFKHPERFAASREAVKDGIARARKLASLSQVTPEMVREAIAPAPPGGTQPTPPPQRFPGKQPAGAKKSALPFLNRAKKAQARFQL